MSGTSPAGWYPDPAGTPGRIRYFDGRAWTSRVGDTAGAPGTPSTTQTTTRPAAPSRTGSAIDGPGDALPGVGSAGTADVHAATPAATRTPFGIPPEDQANAPQPRPGGHHPWSGHASDPSPDRHVSPTLAAGAAPQGESPFSKPPALTLFGVAAGTTQSLLLDDEARNWRPKDRPTSAEAGWYPDPGRTRKLRFYDGGGWTARIRVPLEQQMRSLPQAAITARAKLLSLADDQAARSTAGHKWRSTNRVRVEQPQSLHRVVRGKTGRVGGTLSMAAVLVAVTMLFFAGWQQFGADAWQRHNQDNLRAELTDQFADQGGDGGVESLVIATGDPTPIEIDRPVLQEDRDALDPDPSPAPNPAPQPTRAPRLNEQPADITPFPPANWAPPAGRRARNLSGFALGEAVGRLVIPRMGLDEVMVSGVGANELAKGPGVARYGMLPGSPGNAIIAGHRTGWGEPFRNLDQLRYGDQIIVEIPGQQRSVYEVRSRVIVDPGNTRIAQQTEGVRLTLTTCHPVSVNTHRMIIEAEMIEGPWLDKAVNRSAFRTVS